MHKIANTHTLLRADRLFTGTSRGFIEKAAVLIHNDKIKGVGLSSELQAPDGADVEFIDYGHSTILPGLVDCHTHLCAPGDGTPGDEVAKEEDGILVLQASKNARTILDSGVTTIRENGAKNHVAFSLKEGVRRGISAGPRMVICGRPLSITGGHMGYFGSEADGIDAVRLETRKLIKEGADYIKITATGGSTLTSNPNIASFTVEELRAITNEAQKAGKLTAAHCTSTEGIKNSLDAEVDMIIHCIFNDEQGSYCYSPELVERLIEANAWVNPTLYAFQSAIEHMELKKIEDGLSENEKQSLEQNKRDLETRIESVHKMNNDGVGIVAGSDSPWGYYPPGEFIHEMEYLERAGLSTLEALLSGTSWSAESIGLRDSTGSIMEDGNADLVVVKNDASEGVGALWDVIDVYQAGRRVQRIEH